MAEQTIGPASDAIAIVLITGEEPEPHLLHPGCSCPYCGHAIQMVNGRYRSQASGALHTCEEWIRDKKGRGYVQGVFQLAWS